MLLLPRRHLIFLARTLEKKTKQIVLRLIDTYESLYDLHKIILKQINKQIKTTVTVTKR